MFDSHCHLTDARFVDDLAAVLERAWSAGVTGIVTVASNPADAEAALHLAARDARLRSSAGVHPHVAAEADDLGLERITALAGEPGVVAIGETGLDFHYDNSPRDVQKRLFEWHLRLAHDVSKPVIVHSRTADDDTAAMIRASSGVRGVLHCFAGGPALFDAAMEADWFISFAGLVTFRNFDNQALVRAVPRHRLLAETDSPYLAPMPHRGKRNEPSYVTHTVSALASMRGEDAAETGALVARNARAFYDFSPAAPAA